MKKINEQLKFIREANGFSQEDMAERINKSQSAYARIELGRTKIDFDTLSKFADVFKLSVIDVITFPEKWAPIGSTDNDEDKSRIVLQIELKKEKKDQVLKLVFGENNLEILNK
ncbi:MAG: helix-turn-helix transcriptional regulator [Bacteroidales bacterium]|nr:helix-turn-helix transcriptional regulator [Bacteroidales bacterium]